MTPEDAPAADPVPSPSAVPGGFTPLESGPTLRRAPERREIALTLGIVLLLNIPGGLLLLVNLRWAIFASQVFGIAAPVFLAIRLFFLDARAVLPLRWSPSLHFAGAALGMAGLNHFLTFASIWQDRYFPLPERWQDVYGALASFDGPWDFLILVVLLGVIPGVCEELLFRGFVQSGLVREFESAPKAVVVTSLVFAAFHFNPWLFPMLAVIGLYLGFLAQRTRSLLPGMMAHALNNVLSITVAGLPEVWQERLVQSAWSHAGGLVCLLCAASLLLRAAPGRPETRVL